MKWHLTVDIEMDSSFRKLQHDQKVISVGSCFSEHMGNLMASHKWDVANNPFGILYNPQSIYNALIRILDKKEYQAEELTEHNGLFISMDHHGSFSGNTISDALHHINQNLLSAHEYLERGSTIIVTFGTAWHYVYKKTGKSVANCHKIPADQFDRRQMDIDTIIRLYSDLIQRISSLNNGLQWIFTVSPVRHWKDGGADNHWSKSILTCAARQLEASFKNVHYFPSFEIMIDELRDHRFYAEDLVHPSSQAIDYIWQRFSSNCLSEESILLNEEIRIISNRLEHRPIHPSQPEHEQFLEETQRKIGLLKNKYPHIDF